MNFLIVTGLSGAGKSMAVNALEDIGFFCIDNIPAGLLPRILDFAQQGENQLSRVAVVMDIRGLHSVQETNEALEALDEKKMPYDILFLDASDAAIRRRYKETRRVHPMTISEGIPVSEAITKERQILQPCGTCKICDRYFFAFYRTKPGTCFQPVFAKRSVCHVYQRGFFWFQIRSSAGSGHRV